MSVNFATFAKQIASNYGIPASKTYRWPPARGQPESGEVDDARARAGNPPVPDAQPRSEDAEKPPSSLSAFVANAMVITASRAGAG